MTRGWAAELAGALIAGGLGAFLLIHASDIPFGAGYDRIGPRVFPYAVAIGLMVLGALLVLARLRAQATPAVGPAASEAAPSAVNLVPLAWLGAAIVLVPLTLERIGFVAAAAAQFWLTARAFHSRRPWRDALAAIAVAVVVYVAFARGLGMELPQGPLEALF